MTNVYGNFSKSDLLQMVGSDSIPILDPGSKVAKVIESTISEVECIPLDRTEKAVKARDTFNSLIDTYNKKFGLNVKLDYDNLTESLRVLSDPNSPQVLRALQLYTSQIFSAFQSVIYAKFIQSIMVLASDVLDPQNLLDSNLTFEQKIITIEKLIGFMNKLQSVSKDFTIKGDDLELERLANGTSAKSTEELTSVDIQKALRLLKDSFSHGE